MFGLELHPAVVHFPIALGVVGAAALLAYAIARKVWLRWFGPLLLSVALVGAGAAYFSGQSAHDRAADAGVPHPEIVRHQNTAIYSIGVLALATLLSWATAVGRRGLWIAAPIAVAAAAMLLWTSHLGARLVFIYGAGRVPRSEIAPIPDPGTEPVGEGVGNGQNGADDEAGHQGHRH